MATRKSGSQKTALKTGDLAPPSPSGGARLPLGAHPGNTGGKKGRSGRKPEAFGKLLARLRNSPELAHSLEAAIKDHESRAFASALKVLTDYDDEKPAEKRQIVGPVEVVVKFAREGKRSTAS